jgi:hypothetical protein
MLLANFPPLTSKITMPPIRLEGAKTLAVPAHGAHSKNIEQYDHSMIERHGKTPSHNPEFGRTKMIKMLGVIALAWIATTSVGNAACEQFPDAPRMIRDTCPYGYQCSTERPRFVRRLIVARKRQNEGYGYNSGYNSGY